MLSSLIAMERGLSTSTGGGTHHAGPDYGSGYCLINDLAVAAKFMVGKAAAEDVGNGGFRVMIVDLDVHQVGREEQMESSFLQFCLKFT